MKEELIRPKLKQDLDEIRVNIRNNKYSMNDLRVLHHMERYEFAAQYINDFFEGQISILDIGCGLGHGLNILNQNLHENINADIWGIDIDKSSIEKATVNYENLNFICDDVCNADFNEQFDIIIFFEVLGNENIDSDIKTLHKFNTILSENGCIFISVPSYRDKEPKSYFARLYNQESFENLVVSAYSNKDIYLCGQIHPANRGDILANNNISTNLYRCGDFMLAIIKDKKIGGI